MYSKTEVAQLRQAFWTTFGQYMQPVPSAEGLPTNWVNYKTGLKHVYFRLHADGKRAHVAIDITHRDAGVRELFFEQFREVRPMLEEATGEAWTWEAETQDENGQPIARISQELAPVNLFNRDDWPRLISFFKPRIIALDEFWSMGQYAFEALR
ncbi:DUF4268 domain-containing protein [Hymenobacter busanensis]|uniref:DUF4268 domain-containing protein n=1 Tax=Hymenobacter busanensis TaxID=2607656 RepID=A0A7L5A4H4_9BACT|nr:DUF4268 domain-containing protein [Hymenobacter busanensis]KAA9338552.1 DUF4268 domain-containing protein [Hymenobacter busanensis]QHJ09020.1 DUF4268 domain-containing protein [Hymenobacter busanensis]